MEVRVKVVSIRPIIPGLDRIGYGTAMPQVPISIPNTSFNMPHG